MFYIWLNWNVSMQPTMDDPDRTYIINDHTKEVLKGDVDANGLAMSIIIEILMDE